VRRARGGDRDAVLPVVVKQGPRERESLGPAHRVAMNDEVRPTPRIALHGGLPPLLALSPVTHASKVSAIGDIESRFSPVSGPVARGDGAEKKRNPGREGRPFPSCVRKMRFERARVLVRAVAELVG
jgi:hypothetical protein